MPLMMESFDSLPYVDFAVTDGERTQILKSIAAELPAGYQTKTHPSLPPFPETKFTPLMQAEIERSTTGEPMKDGIDMSRYEAPDEPSDNDEFQWRTALQAAYRSSSYLDYRHINLSLLEEYGKNSWLIGNSQLEELFQQTEKELATLKEATENINRARKAAQEGSRGELMALEESWKTGVGKIIEVQVASDGLRKEILRRRRVR